LAGVALPSRLDSDAIMVTKAMTASTIAEIYIEKDAIRVELEIGVPDLEGFRDLLPDAIYEKLGHDPKPLANRLADFFREDLVFQQDGGAPLAGKVEAMEGRRRVPRDEVTGEPLPVADDEGEPVIFATLVYPLRGKPKVLTLQPPRDERGNANANIGFIVYHRGLPVNDFRYLGAEETLRLNWTDPWYSRFDNRNLRRQFDAPISAFLYVEPYEVRKEIVLRPRDLQGWVDLGLDGKEILTIDEQEDVKRKVVEFLAERTPVTIDGMAVEGTLDRVHFIYRNLRTSGVIDPPRDLDLISATLGVIFYYPTSGLPKEVTLEWELFDDRIVRIPASATDEAGALPYVLFPDDPVLKWQNFLKNPTIPGLVEVQAPPTLRRLWFVLLTLLSVTGLVFLATRYRKITSHGKLLSWKPLTAMTGAVALVGLGIFAIPQAVSPSYVSDGDAATIVTGLLENIYRSFDYREESVIYDSLERSATGELLTDIYLETRRSLELENQGGARAKVKEIEMLESSQEPLPGEVGFIAHSTWNVSGSVGHWGHIHQRRNQYEARFVVKAVDGAWKITDLELLQEERL
jgi:hypothetical protein